MVQVRAGEASACFARARRAAKRHFTSDPCVAVCVAALMIELDLERDRKKAVEPRTLKALGGAVGHLDGHRPGPRIAVSAELTFEQHDAEPDNEWGRH